MKKNKFKKLKKKEDNKIPINNFNNNSDEENFNIKKNNIKKNSRLKRIRKIISLNVTYNKIKFKNNLYSISDSIFVKDQYGNNVIAKIKKILKLNGFKKYPFWPTIEVEW
jgi:hypothetical protein